MKDTRFIIIAAGGITIGLLLLATVIATGWFLYGVEIKTSSLEDGQFMIGDPIINRSSYKIAYADHVMFDYVSHISVTMQWYEPTDEACLLCIKNGGTGISIPLITDWALLHETVKWNKDLRVDKGKQGKPILADPKLR